jgi:phosphatidylserine decarboxylase
MTFARESFPIVAPFAMVCVAALVWSYYRGGTGMFYTGLSFGLVGFILLLFFRDPERTIPIGNGLITSPADGTVLLSEILPDGQRHVAIFMSVFNVHINRTPVTGKVERVTNIPGRYFNAATNEAAAGNARVEVEASTQYGTVIWRQVSGAIARKIACRLKPGDVFQQGERYGLIYFGSRMEVFLPASAELLVKPDQKVRAGETLIAKFTVETTL